MDANGELLLVKKNNRGGADAELEAIYFSLSLCGYYSIVTAIILICDPNKH
jgi:hypothetical protein